jgi:transposase
VAPVVPQALPNAMIGLRLVVFTAWLHYLVGVSEQNLVQMVSVFSSFKVTAGDLTQAWKNLASLLARPGQQTSFPRPDQRREHGWR